MGRTGMTMALGSDKVKGCICYPSYLPDRRTYMCEVLSCSVRSMTTAEPSCPRFVFCFITAFLQFVAPCKVTVVLV